MIGRYVKLTFYRFYFKFYQESHKYTTPLTCRRFNDFSSQFDSNACRCLGGDLICQISESERLGGKIDHCTFTLIFHWSNLKFLRVIVACIAQVSSMMDLLSDWIRSSSRCL